MRPLCLFLRDRLGGCHQAATPGVDSADLLICRRCLLMIRSQSSIARTSLAGLAQQRADYILCISRGPVM